MVRGAKLYFQHNFNYIVSMSLLVEETGVAYREKTTNLSQVTNKTISHQAASTSTPQQGIKKNQGKIPFLIYGMN